jgi:hypothetical protein
MKEEVHHEMTDCDPYKARQYGRKLPATMSKRLQDRDVILMIDPLPSVRDNVVSEITRK